MQGDPIAPFLFCLVAHALSMYVRKVEPLNIFTGSKGVSVGLSVMQLRYVDHTFLIGRTTVKNL